MEKKKHIKKCPVCNSSRYHKNEGKSRCDKCGFTNLTKNNVMTNI